MVCPGRRMGNHAVSRPRIIGVDAPGYAEPDRIPDGGTGKTTKGGGRRNRTFQDQHNHIRHLPEIHQNNPQSHENIQRCHDRHCFRHHPGDAPESAPDCEKTGESDGGSRIDRGKAESLAHGPGHRLCLHGAGPGPEQEAEHRQYYGAPFPSQRILQHERPVAHIFIHTFPVVFPVPLSDDDLTGFRGHPEERRHPHPHQGSRSAADDRCGYTADIPCSYGIGQGRTRRPESGNRAFSLPFSKHTPERIPEVEADLPLIPEAEADRQDHPRHQDNHGHRCAPNEIIDGK